MPLSDDEAKRRRCELLLRAEADTYRTVGSELQGEALRIYNRAADKAILALKTGYTEAVRENKPEEP